MLNRALKLSLRAWRPVLGLAAIVAAAGCTGGGSETTDGSMTPDPSTSSGGSSSGDGPTSEDAPTPTTGAAPTSETTSDPSGEPPDTSSTSDPSDPSSTSETTGEPPVDPGWAPRTSARIFVSGHSLTDNPLADFVGEIAESLGNDYNYNQQIGIGSPIRVRTLGNSWNNLDYPGYKTGKNRDGNDMDVVAELLNPQTLGPGERYDTLVITERHDILSTIQWEDTAGLLRHYHDRLIDGNPGGETLLYHSWLDINKNAPEQWITHEKNALVAWECVAAKVNLTLEADGRPDRVVPLPVGAALVHLVERVLADEVAGISGPTNQRLNLLFNDNVHLTPLGVYYAALVTYSAVYRSSPVGAAVPQGVAPEPAADMQQIAWDFVRDYYTSPEFGPRTMEECREFIAGQVCASFWTLLGQPNNISGCQNNFSNADPQNSGNPFRWPDPGYTPWPPPP